MTGVFDQAFIIGAMQYLMCKLPQQIKELNRPYGCRYIAPLTTTHFQVIHIKISQTMPENKSRVQYAAQNKSCEHVQISGQEQ